MASSLSFAASPDSVIKEAVLSESSLIHLETARNNAERSRLALSKFLLRLDVDGLIHKDHIDQEREQVLSLKQDIQPNNDSVGGCNPLLEFKS